ncbi:MAG TPA: serine hydrolase domain-containing protein [Methylomirabilota bacterium]|jgi:CubicO group peptidase (beta-lactamase class C family)
MSPAPKRAFSRPRLRRLHDVMKSHIDGGYVPGVVTVLSRRGEVHVDALGATAAGGRAPMRRDTLFRITSMTKPIAAVAAMILVEECRLRLDEPVDRLLPELADRRVLKAIDRPLEETVPAHRAITVRDLLTFRLGLGMIWGPPDVHPIQKAIGELGIVGFGPPDQSTPHDADEWMRRLGTLPLMHQPGERWLYNTGSSILGVLIARASGQPFDAFLQERVFQPLGMRDTGFSVPRAKLARLAPAYWPNATTGALELHDGVADSRWSRPPVFADGGAGLVSTADDYLAFGRMLLNKGRHGRERILSRPSVELMTTDHLTPNQKATSSFFPGQWDGRGWGFGMSVVTRRDDLAAVPGRFGWDGGYGTSWASDPAEDMVAILMTQRAVFPLLSPIYLDFWTSAYQAIDD